MEQKGGLGAHLGRKKKETDNERSRHSRPHLPKMEGVKGPTTQVSDLGHKEEQVRSPSTLVGGLGTADGKDEGRKTRLPSAVRAYGASCLAVRSGLRPRITSQGIGEGGPQKKCIWESTRPEGLLEFSLWSCKFTSELRAVCPLILGHPPLQ